MIGPEVTVPDVTEAVVGYRTFALDSDGQFNYRLVSPNQGEPWPAVEMTARCAKEIPVPEGIILPQPPKPHRAPHKGCSCGIYVYFDPCPVGNPPRDPYRMSFGYDPDTPSWYRATKVQALMSLSGTIEVHRTGMRAERGRICALGVNGRLGGDERVALAELGKRFGVPVVHEDELPNLACEFGRPLGPEFRPAPPEVELPPEPAGAPTYTPTNEPYPCPKKPSRHSWGVIAANGGALATNAVLFGLWHSPVAAACMAVSAFFTGMGVNARRTHA